LKLGFLGGICAGELEAWKEVEMLMMMGSVDGKFTNKDLGTDYEELTNMRQERREQRRRRGRLG
jgi:hypothetical protein